MSHKAKSDNHPPSLTLTLIPTPRGWDPSSTAGKGKELRSLGNNVPSVVLNIRYSFPSLVFLLALLSWVYLIFHLLQIQNSFFLNWVLVLFIFFVHHILCPSVRTDQISSTVLNDEGAAISGHWPQSLCLKYTLCLHLT